MFSYLLDAYCEICDYCSSSDRTKLLMLRKSRLENLSNKIIKLAFDSRRINQITDFNPRRNLQYYSRSEPFVSDNLADTIKNLFKIKTAVDLIKEEYYEDPNWLDSYCRVLSATVDKTLRVAQKDMDFSKPQMDYLEELLYLRYRLKHEDIEKYNEQDLKKIIISKDEKLYHRAIFSNYESKNIQKKSNIEKNYDLIEKLMGAVKANAESPDITRSITITVNDKINK